MKDKHRLLMFILLSLLFYFQITDRSWNIYLSSLKNGKIYSQKSILLNKNRKKIQEIKKKIDLLKKDALRKDDFINFTYRLNDLVKKTRINASELSYLKDEKAGKFTVKRFQFTVSGEYKDIRIFLDKLEKEFPYIIIDNIFQKEQSGEFTTLKLGGVILII